MKESVWNDRPWRSRDTRETIDEDYRYESVSQLLDQFNEGKISLDGLVAIYRQQFDPNRYED